MRDDNREQLNFLYEDDILPVLEKLGLKEHFLNGQLKCSICGDIITIDNLYSIYYENGVKISCNKGACVNTVEKKKL